jgi:hypothetical protein
LEGSIRGKDFLIVPKTYFDVMQKKLQELAKDVDISDFKTMEKFLYLRDWLNASKVDRETRVMYPDMNFDNIHLLLQQEKDYSD